MFENLLNQEVSKLLREDILKNKLPPSLLFSGPVYSGKMTTALELARVLSCTKDASWQCDCPECSKHKMLIHQDLLIVGTRTCPLEIAAAADSLKKNRTKATCFLFVRSVRKLLNRFHPVLWEGEDSKINKAESIFSSIYEDLELLNPLEELPEDSVLQKLLDEIVDSCTKIESDFLPSSVPVSQVRRVAVWAHTKPIGKKKVLIIENADTMSESARNAFLKILEEPPEDIQFILTTSKRGAIMPTILSRVRTYSFIDRSIEVQQSVLKRVFHREDVLGETSLLEKFFNSFLPVSESEIKIQVAIYFQSILNYLDEKRIKTSQVLKLYIKNIFDELQNENSDLAILQPNVQVVSAYVTKELNKFDPKIIFSLFLKTLLEVIRKSCNSNTNPSSREIEVFAKISLDTKNAYEAVFIYNQSALAVLESLAEKIISRFCSE